MSVSQNYNKKLALQTDILYITNQSTYELDVCIDCTHSYVLRMFKDITVIKSSGNGELRIYSL